MTNSQRRTILVTDGEQRAALAIVRSLGAAGHRVHVCSANGRSLAGASRWARRDRAVADPLESPDRYVCDIRRMIRDYAIDTVIAITEPALLALLPVRHTFPDVLFPGPDAETFARICDKQLVLSAAADLGIAVPRQYVLDDDDAVDRIDLERLTFPLVIKPARSVGGGSGERVKVSASHAATPKVLAQKLATTNPRAYPLLLQQRVVGPGVGIFLLIWNGEVRAEFSHLRLREQPPSGGVSVYRSSIALDKELRDLSTALLHRFNWNGVAMIEYKIDAATGTPYLMEINGRFWGSLQLAVDAGVDFPRLLLDAALDRPWEPTTTYALDVRSRWLWGDVDHLLARLRTSEAELDLPPGSPSVGEALRAFFKHDPRDVDEIFRTNDSRPFVRESVQWLQHVGRS